MADVGSIEPKPVDSPDEKKGNTSAGFHGFNIKGASGDPKGIGQITSKIPDRDSGFLKA